MFVDQIGMAATATFLITNVKLFLTNHGYHCVMSLMGLWLIHPPVYAVTLSVTNIPQQVFIVMLQTAGAVVLLGGMAEKKTWGFAKPVPEGNTPNNLFKQKH